MCHLRALLILSFATLVGCGGGGGGESTPANTASTPNTWSAQAYVKASNAEAGDQLGSAVAISGDTMVVGVPFEDSNQTTITNGNTATTDNSLSNAGAAYVYVRNGGNWTQQAYLKAPNADAGDEFGAKVAIDGDTIVIGSKEEDSTQTTITNGNSAAADNAGIGVGAAYVFVRSSGVWAQQAYLKAPNAQTGDRFASAVGISGDTIVVGAEDESSNQTTITNGSSASTDNSAGFAGAAYVFTRTGSTWSQQAYLKAPNADSSDFFGSRVAIDSDTIVVATTGEDSNQTTITNGSAASTDNSASTAGAAYVFVRSGSIWSHQAYLKASNTQTDDQFGFSVAISNNTIVVGAHFEDSNQTTITNGTTSSADNSASTAGAAYVFVRANNGTWSQQAYLKASNANANDRFGRGVGISGDTIVVSANQEGSAQTTITNGNAASADNSAFGAGAAYVFTRNGSTWSQQAYLKAPNAEGPNDVFGTSVAVSGHTVVVGAIGEDSNQNTITNGNTASADNSATSSGAVYIFLRN